MILDDLKTILTVLNSQITDLNVDYISRNQITVEFEYGTNKYRITLNPSYTISIIIRNQLDLCLSNHYVLSENEYEEFVSLFKEIDKSVKQAIEIDISKLAKNLIS